MTTLRRNWVEEIARRVSRSFHPQPLPRVVFHPPRTGIIRMLRNYSLRLSEVFQAPKLTPLTLCSIKTIRASATQERKNVLDRVSLTIG